MKANRRPEPSDLGEAVKGTPAQKQAWLDEAIRLAGQMTGVPFRPTAGKMEVLATGQVVKLPTWPLLASTSLEEDLDLGIVWLPDTKQLVEINYLAGLRDDDWPAVAVELVLELARELHQTEDQRRRSVSGLVNTLRTMRKREEERRDNV